eukprot:CAMPEP_0168764200 /NCGR_PEP_ID=MMETSP0724-20121128/24753_1 /TAXON_ID=265536 /ORGANISM="Amphiprora sp., Strain CCMP467" /LENGTH=582 /DNA_ID=CAMNT_0008813421 /DNA_START=92 /DNA_END=1840 /DNA_ORIENTATION=+
MALLLLLGVALAATILMDGVVAFQASHDFGRARVANVHQSRFRSNIELQSSLSVDRVSDDKAATTTSKEEESKGIRPLHQNWWPVVTVDSLKEDRPNQIRVLGKPLVTYFNQKDEEWKVLDDMCSHRFAPLSEGRVLNGNLQCAYHGWCFDSSGTCTRVPQQPDRVDKAKPVQSYAVKKDLGILWVWMDPETLDSIGNKIRLPIDPLLRKCYEGSGDTYCFMRDLPYGMEILGENLLDLSHLPYAHHSVGNLKRSLGNELPTRMLSLKEREEFATWEQGYDASADPVLPKMQAEIMQAAAHDPIFAGFYDANNPDQFANWTTKIGFFEPFHARYTRFGFSTSTVELFMCPLSEGKSRVFLFNCFDMMVTKPKTLKDKIFKILLNTRLGGSKGHMIAHKIFDGDGIFLHKQGNRMKVANKSFKDYSTPASADVLLNSYRRYLDVAAEKTRQAGLNSVAATVVGMNKYGDDAPRAELLDRYNTHTVHCSICMKDLQNARKRNVNLQRLETALQGTTGSGIAALLTFAAIRRLSSMAIPGTALGATALASTVGLAGSFLTARLRRSTDKTINGFLFEDYVHADKN